MPSAMIFCGLDLIMPSSCNRQRIEAYRVFGIVVPPSVERDLLQGFDGVIISRRETVIDKPPRDGLRVADAEICCFEDSTQHALGCDGILADEFPVARNHAAEMFRPRAVFGAVEHHVADMPGAQLLGLGRNPRYASILPSAKSPAGLGHRLVTQRISLIGSSPT